MGFIGVDLHKTNLDDNNDFDEDYLDAIIHVRLSPELINLRKR